MAESIGSVFLDLILNSKPFEDQLGKTTKQAIGSMSSTFGKFGRMIGGAFAIGKLVQFGKASIDLASDLTEVQNVVDVVFGESANRINAFAKSALQSYGLSELSAKQYTSTMGAMLKSMGLTQNKVISMSESITALTGDMASFYNLDTDTAFQKIRSGISGETEPLKQLGINMSVANMEAYALSQGITTSYQKMTQSEQALLRYNYLLSVTADAQGDFARTSNSWANQVRILGEQFNSLRAILGSAFITALTPVVKWLNVVISKLMVAAAYFKAFVEALTGVKSESSSLSVSTGDVSGGLGGVSDAADQAASATDKAVKSAKAAKNALAGFDKLNILPSSSDSGSGGSGGSSGGGAAGASGDLGLGSLADAKVPDLMPEIDTTKVTLFADKVKQIWEYVPVIAAGIAGWKLGKFIADLALANVKADTLKQKLSLLGKKMTLTAGVILTVTGIALETKGIVSSVQEGLNKINFAEILGGGGMVIGGAALIGKTFGQTLLASGIGAVVAGIPMYITGLFDAVTNGLNLLNALLIPAGSTIAGAGVGAIIGSLGGPIGAGIGALIGLVVGAVTDLTILIVQNWDSIVAWCEQALDSIGQFFSDTWASITAIWGTVAGWFSSTVIEPVVGFFTGLWEGISKTASDCWDSIVGFFSPAINWFSQLFGSIHKTISDVFYNIGVIAKGCWEIIKAVWGVVSNWFNTNIIQPVSKFFTTLWNGISTAAVKAWDAIKSVLSTVGSWINTNIIQPVSKFFTSLWEGFSSKASVAWNTIKQVFSTVAQFFESTFSKAWQGIVKVFSIGGKIFTDIKNGILNAFKKVVNGLIKGLNRVIAVPFNGINSALEKIKNIKILNLHPFSGLRSVSVPSIPYLAKGGIIDQPTLAMVGESGKEAVVPLENTAFAESIAQALLKVLAPLISASTRQNRPNGNNEGNSTIILKVGEYELGRIVVGAINKYHTTIGKVELEVI